MIVSAGFSPWTLSQSHLFCEIPKSLWDRQSSHSIGSPNLPSLYSNGVPLVSMSSALDAGCGFFRLDWCLYEQQLYWHFADSTAYTLQVESSRRPRNPLMLITLKGKQNLFKTNVITSILYNSLNYVFITFYNNFWKYFMN